MPFQMEFSPVTDNYPLVEIPGMDGLWHINSRSPGMGGDAWIHLIPGTERAVLLDTGFGLGDLRGLVESLTDLPYDVVNSHNHPDHVGGNFQWDRILIHPYEFDGLRDQMTDTVVKLPMPAPEDRCFVYTEQDVIPPSDYEFVPVEDGQIFDLGGGYELEAIHVPGHAAGGIVLLDRKRRILFSGDAFLPSHVLVRGPLPGMPANPWNTVEKFREGIEKVLARMDDFDVIYGGHSRLGFTKQLVTDFAACCDELLAGDLSVNEQPVVPASAGFAGGYHRHGLARICFTPASIHA